MGLDTEAMAQDAAVLLAVSEFSAAASGNITTQVGPAPDRYRSIIASYHRAIRVGLDQEHTSRVVLSSY